ncbi:hypothetical protein [Knoellia koreensis]|jgi:hypothetical protein|uniref:Uncharacterized protein n=1 Tax=Knoellia koreensis TaxID=2730921 RepID=A0A849HFQ6_9MICO|nr:hypothetical protein [Knoellia sp. DB2414S]NNM45979.1 hypothetical protein [Knoellia sp. DB2414S]
MSENPRGSEAFQEAEKKAEAADVDNTDTEVIEEPQETGTARLVDLDNEQDQATEATDADGNQLEIGD